MMDFLLETAQAPKYATYEDVWKYSELKKYFERLMVDYELMSATKLFLSNVEGLGDYFDNHAFFDFQAYLILNVFWYEKKKKKLDPDTDEYKRFSVNIKVFVSGKCDKWAINKKELDYMKSDCSEIMEYYL